MVICFLFGAYIAAHEPGAVRRHDGRTYLRPGDEIISDTARSNIPALGYVRGLTLSPTFCNAGEDAYCHHLAGLG